MVNHNCKIDAHEPSLGEGAPLTLMYRDNGDTAWWTVLETPVRGFLKDGETFKIVANLTRAEGK